jgi:glycerol-3-phosphate cytidylyltransferase
MLSEAKGQCDYLIACIHADPSIENPTKNKPIQSLLERQIQVNGCRFVDETIVYQTEEDLRNILRTVPWDVRIIGEEYINKHFTGKNEFDLPSKKVYYNYRQHTFSSSELRNRIKDIN